MKYSDVHVQGIGDLRMPRNGEYVMRFLVLAYYFSEFIDHFEEAARPLNVILCGTGFKKQKKPGKRLVIPD